MIFQPKLKEKTKVTLLNPVPTITISQNALDKMQIYIESVNIEIGWLGTLIKKAEDHYYLEDVFLLEQKCHGTNTTITADGQSKLIMELMEKGKLDVLNNIKFWGHSHVNMDVSPSTQDEDTLKMLKPDVNPDFFLRGIFNKSGKVKFTLYDYINNMIVDNVDWSPEKYLNESLISEIKAEIKEKVTEKTYVHKRALPFNRGLHRYSNLSYIMKDNQHIIEDLEDEDELDEDEFLNRINDYYDYENLI